MKRIVALILAIALLAALCACGGKKDEGASTRPTGTDVTEAQTEADTGESEGPSSGGVYEQVRI